MPTSAPGHSNRAAAYRPRQQTGFSLIELLVVVTIIAIATAMVGFGAFDRTTSALTTDANRLVQLFQTAQTEAHASGRAIVWESNASGYRFTPRIGFTANSPRALVDSSADRYAQDRTLRPRQWDAGAVEVTVIPADTAVFTTEWIAAPMRIELSSAAQRIVIYRDGAGQYQVQQ